MRGSARGVLVLLSLLAQLHAAPAAARVVLIGLDGGSWNVIDPMLAAGELPHLEALIERGVSAELATVEPVNSPVVWTSIATGRSPEAHGVGDFFTTALRNKVPTAFERLAATGLRVGLYDYLVTWPPVALPGGFVIPGWLRRDASVTPADVWSRIPLSPFVNDYDGAHTSEDYLRLAQREVEEKAKRFVALSRAFDLEVGAVTFYAIDATSHRFWEAAFGGERSGAAGGYSDAERGAIRQAVLGLDRAIGEIVAPLDRGDSVLIASDHGFRAADDPRVVWVAHFDEALAQAGLSPARDGFRLISSFGAVTLRIHPGPFAERDALTARLLALLDSYRNEEGEPLFSATEVIDVAERPPEAARGWLGRLRQWILRQLVWLRFHVEIEQTAHAIVFGLPDGDALEALWPDGAVQIGDRRLPVSSAFGRQRFTGRHDPTAIFAAAGGPIAAGRERGALSVLDIAPLLFYLNGQAIPDDLEGELPVELLDAEHLRQFPPRRVPAADTPTIPRAGEAGDAEVGPALTEKLRALGYIE